MFIHPEQNINMTIKKDWETLKETNEKLRKQMTHDYAMAMPQTEVLIKLAQSKIDEFILTEAKDPMPEDLKKVIKEVK